MSKRTTAPTLLAIFILAFLLGHYSNPNRAPEEQIQRPASNPGTVKPAWEIYFSPDGGCTEAIVSALEEAQKSVRVQAYSFTSSPIAAALVEAQKRGAAVQVILDKSNETERYSAADFLLHAEVPTYIDAAHAIAHNKVMIIDGETVITGSFNFTKSAESRNAENLLMLHDAALAKHYADNWQAHREHSEAYVR
jgi:phosphatidylserine/phosphatidylglycerophosphate/cardiolipin synthase-like enzyme